MNGLSPDGENLMHILNASFGGFSMGWRLHAPPPPPFRICWQHDGILGGGEGDFKLVLIATAMSRDAQAMVRLLAGVS